MKISVITINYNNLNGLEKTLRSVFEQTYQDFEFIVIDGGSQDGSRELIESYSEKFDYWVSEPDKGIYNAMNKGVARATGEYVIHMNSGDTFYEKFTLEKVVPALALGEDFIYGDAFFFNRFDGEPDSLWIYPKILSFDFFCIGALNHQAVFIKRSLFNKVGGYNESYKLISDWLFTVESFLFHKATYKHLNLTVCNYDQNGYSAHNWDKAVKERDEALRERFSFFYHKHKEDDSGPVLKKKAPVSLKFSIKKFLKVILPYGLVRYRQIRLHQKKNL